MRALLQHKDGAQELILLDDAITAEVAIIQRGQSYYIFDGYLGGYAHTAVFTECAVPLILAELTPKPARKFMGQKPKDE
jgi:hypothetical protein